MPPASSEVRAKPRACSATHTPPATALAAAIACTALQRPPPIAHTACWSHSVNGSSGWKRCPAGMSIESGSASPQ
jgi:hypothetical protein